MNDDELATRLRELEMANIQLHAEILAVKTSGEKDIEILGEANKRLEKELGGLKGGINRGLWILGGGFLTSLAAWVAGGGLVK